MRFASLPQRDRLEQIVEDLAVGADGKREVPFAGPQLSLRPGPRAHPLAVGDRHEPILLAMPKVEWRGDLAPPESPVAEQRAAVVEPSPDAGGPTVRAV